MSKIGGTGGKTPAATGGGPDRVEGEGKKKKSLFGTLRKIKLSSEPRARRSDPAPAQMSIRPGPLLSERDVEVVNPSYIGLEIPENIEGSPDHQAGEADGHDYVLVHEYEDIDILDESDQSSQETDRSSGDSDAGEIAPQDYEEPHLYENPRQQGLAPPPKEDEYVYPAGRAPKPLPRSRLPLPPKPRKTATQPSGYDSLEVPPLPPKDGEIAASPQSKPPPLPPKGEKTAASPQTKPPIPTPRPKPPKPLPRTHAKKSET